MIDNELLSAYVTELEALRTHGAQFAEVFPDIASRLDLGSRRSSDPQVERVVESTAFLAARLRLLVESNAAQIPASVLATVAPVLCDPVPSMAIVEFHSGSEEQRVARGTKLDYRVNQDRLFSFRTTMDTVLAPYRVVAHRMGRSEERRDTLSVRFEGTPPSRPVLYVGRDDLSAAVLLDALSKSLVRVEIERPGAGERDVFNAHTVRFLGFSSSHAALPDRDGAHRAHRLLVEFINFSEKFRFIELALPVRIPSGTVMHFVFSRDLALDAGSLDALLSANCVPVVNLWPAAATPFDLSGRSLEYPVRVDTVRSRIVECHSVESVTLFGQGQARSVKLDPLVGPGRRAGTEVEWGVRRGDSRTVAQVWLHFRGLDYQRLGREKLLVAPNVLASNGRFAASARAGSELVPVESFGDWRARLSAVPSAYLPALDDADAMRMLAGHLRSRLRGLCVNDAEQGLREYLSYFPGSERAGWIAALGRLAVRPVLALRSGRAVPATRAFIAFDAQRSPGVSYATLERVLRAVFDAHRTVNTVEEVVLLAS